jgi:anti-anti-sigma regulatory factor
MVLETHQAGKYRVLHIKDQAYTESDLAELKKQVESYLEEGSINIALSLNAEVYPYSRLISLIIQCNKMAKKHGGTMAVIQSNKEFKAVIKAMRLDVVVAVYDSEKELI